MRAENLAIAAPVTLLDARERVGDAIRARREEADHLVVTRELDRPLQRLRRVGLPRRVGVEWCLRHVHETQSRSSLVTEFLRHS
jgi:hypothetical protein